MLVNYTEQACIPTVLMTISKSRELKVTEKKYIAGYPIVNHHECCAMWLELQSCFCCPCATGDGPAW